MTTKPPNPDATRLLAILGQHRDFMHPDAIAAFQELADDMRGPSKPPNLPSEEIAVTQADREAAAAQIDREHGRRDFTEEQGMRSGEADDHPLVQAFARHRLAHSPSPPSLDVEREAQWQMLDQVLSMLNGLDIPENMTADQMRRKIYGEVHSMRPARPHPEPELPGEVADLLDKWPLILGDLQAEGVRQHGQATMLGRLLHHSHDLIEALLTRLAGDKGEGEALVREALGGYSLNDGTLEESLTNFVGNLDYYAALDIGEAIKREYATAAAVIRALAALQNERKIP